MGMFISKYKDDAFQPPYELAESQLAETKGGWYREAPYPYGFAPTFHQYRLHEPANMKKPQNIFVCSMADLFGDWVPDEWINMVFNACRDAPQHTYMFLTKNPKRYSDLFASGNLPEDFWYGYTATKTKDLWKFHHENDCPCAHLFVSIEPILEPIPPMFHSHIPADWVIIGAETGRRFGKVVPKREWIEKIVNYCTANQIPVFMKSSLAEIWEEPLIQQWPEGLKLKGDVKA